MEALMEAVWISSDLTDFRQIYSMYSYLIWWQPTMKMFFCSLRCQVLLLTYFWQCTCRCCPTVRPWHKRKSQRQGWCFHGTSQARRYLKLDTVSPTALYWTYQEIWRYRYLILQRFEFGETPASNCLGFPSVKSARWNSIFRVYQKNWWRGWRIRAFDWLGFLMRTGMSWKSGKSAKWFEQSQMRKSKSEPFVANSFCWCIKNRTLFFLMSSSGNRWYSS